MAKKKIEVESEYIDYFAELTQESIDKLFNVLENRLKYHEETREMVCAKILHHSELFRDFGFLRFEKPNKKYDKSSPIRSFDNNEFFIFLNYLKIIFKENKYYEICYPKDNNASVERLFLKMEVFRDIGGKKARLGIEIHQAYASAYYVLVSFSFEKPRKDKVDLVKKIFEPSLDYCRFSFFVDGFELKSGIRFLESKND